MSNNKIETIVLDDDDNVSAEASGSNSMIRHPMMRPDTGGKQVLTPALLLKKSFDSFMRLTRMGDD